MLRWMGAIDDDTLVVTSGEPASANALKRLTQSRTCFGRPERLLRSLKLDVGRLSSCNPHVKPTVGTP